MAIDEGSRHRLFTRLEEVLGAEEASSLMAHLPPVGWAGVATKADLVALRAGLDGLRAASKADLDTLEARVDAKLHRMESRLLRTILFTNSASVLTVGGLAFAAARLI
jgi:hypothetical protein